MQAKSPAWWTALASPGPLWRYGLDILASDEVTPLENSNAYDLNAADRLLDQSGSVTLDVTAKTHRTATLTLRNSDGRYLPGPAGGPSGGAGSPTATGLVWYNVRYRPWADLCTGYDANQNPIYDRTYFGMYVLLTPQVDHKPVGTAATLALADKSALLRAPFLITNATLPTFTKSSTTVGGYAAGTTFDSAMHDLATRGGIPLSRQNYEPSTLTLPADYAVNEGTSWWTHLTTLAGSMAHVIYFDGLGNLVRRGNPLLVNAPSTYTFTPGANCIVTDAQRTTDLTNIYNHVIVVGASSQTATVRGEAQLLDAGSPYYKSQIGDRVVFVGAGGKLNDMTPDPAIGTVAQAQSVAQAILVQHLGRQEALSLKGRNLPALEPFDRVTVAGIAGLNVDFIVNKLTWNLHHGGMQIDLARWLAVGS